MMGRRRGRGYTDLPMNAEINVTSLIDVAFTLLVIFLITAPALTAGLEVNLPQTQSQPLTISDEPFIVTIDENDRIFIGETPVTRDEFEVVLNRLMDAAGARDAYLRADERGRTGATVWVLGYLSSATKARGGTMGFVVEPEPRR
jgi:biopolymer transport protein TolR